MKKVKSPIWTIVIHSNHRKTSTKLSFYRKHHWKQKKKQKDFQANDKSTSKSNNTTRKKNRPNKKCSAICTWTCTSLLLFCSYSYQNINKLWSEIFWNVYRYRFVFGIKTFSYLTIRFENGFKLSYSVHTCLYVSHDI